MGIFDFFKKKPDPKEELMSGMMNSMLPRGPKDIEAGTNEVSRILKNRIDRQSANDIFLKSIAISRIAQNFDEERLHKHLQGYALHHFRGNEVKELFDYLSALKAAMIFNQKSPCEVESDGQGTYFW